MVDTALTAWLLNMGIVTSETPNYYKVTGTDIGQPSTNMSNDIREVAYGFVQALYEAQEALPAASRPRYMTIDKKRIISGDGFTDRFELVFGREFSGGTTATLET